MDFLVHRYPVVIKETHLDSFGHVNNATYLQLFEEARWEWITQNGYGFDVVHEKKIGPTIVEVTLKYRKELRLREAITIESRVLNYEGKVGDLIQEMKNTKGELCCEARFKFGLFDMQARKLILPTPEWLKAIGGAS